MLFLVVSSPRHDRPSDVSHKRQDFWRWLEPLKADGTCKWGYARVGRGAVALFEVDSNETLHRLLNEWSDIIPVGFDVFPLIDIADSKVFLDSQQEAD